MLKDSAAPGSKVPPMPMPMPVPSSSSYGQPDLVMHSGVVVTAEVDTPPATAIAVRDGRIVAIGGSAELRALAGSRTRLVDLAGGSVLPGINDSHLHLQWYAAARARLDLSRATTLEQVLSTVEAWAHRLPEDAWVIGRGWREEQLGDHKPLAVLLDRVAGGRPAYLEHASAHGAWLNTEALRRAGITATTATPLGGGISRGRDGSPSGLLTETALELAQRVVPAATAEDRRAATLVAMRHLNTLGVTSITDPLVTPDMLRDYVALRRDDALTARLTVLLHWSWPSVQTPLARLAEAMRSVGSSTGLGDDLLRIGGCKLFADGVPTLGTAWMSRAYPDGTHGHLVTEGADDAERTAELAASIELLHRHRFQVQVHATGDRACAEVVRAMDAAARADPWPEARHVLIHANLLDEKGLEILAQHGFVANTNALIRAMAGPRLVEQLCAADWERTMDVRAMLDAGVTVADSSDAPITEPDWRRAVQLLVTRPDIAGRAGVAEQRLTRLEAIRAWTAGPAYQDGAERRKGTMTVGKRADLVVLAEDILTVPDEEISTVTPVLTLLGGQVVAST